MYARKYSLKTRYNFNKVLKHGLTYEGGYFIVKYIEQYVKGKNMETKSEGKEKIEGNKIDEKNEESGSIIDETIPNFGIIASSKFSKSAVIKNETKRLIGESIRIKLDKFPSNYLYIFIPKKNILDSGGKLKINAKEISTEVDTFLSKMVINGSRKT